MMKRIFGLVLVVAGFAVVSAQEAPQRRRAQEARGRPAEQFVLAPKAAKLSDTSRRTSRTPSSPTCWRSTKGRPTGSSRSSTTTTCTRTTFRWGPARRRRAG